MRVVRQRRPQKGSVPLEKPTGHTCLCAETSGREIRRREESAPGARRTWGCSPCRLRSHQFGPESRRTLAHSLDPNSAVPLHTIACRRPDPNGHINRNTFPHTGSRRTACASPHLRAAGLPHPRDAFALVHRPTSGRPYRYRAACHGGLGRRRGTERGARDYALTHEGVAQHEPDTVYGLLSLCEADPALVQRDVGMALASEFPDLARRAARRLAAQGEAKEERRRGTGKAP